MNRLWEDDNPQIPEIDIHKDREPGRYVPHDGKDDGAIMAPLYDFYIIGSLRNPEIPAIHRRLAYAGLVPFSEWFAAGPEADDRWRDYETALGTSYRVALELPHARTVFDFDRDHQRISHAALLVNPTGRSGHLELGVMIGEGKPGYILLSGKEDRWDVMYRYATLVTDELDEIVTHYRKWRATQ